MTHLISIHLSDGSHLRSAITFHEGQWHGVWGTDPSTGLARLHPVRGDTLEARYRDQALEVHHEAYMAESWAPGILSVSGPLPL
ncbi:hypothetical protein DFI_18930 (plasmid) [Deinococcus ficus]|uniref:Uncharacterized protein n=1 Tax=Deinococcus ficus TaxID=317577 RepID=A0A221T2Z4_9DEIO|nr:hypothetical protein DFI_18930 [Deinococcus ficus]